MIAHRLSTIESADQILVLEKGKIVEQGTHVQLTKKQKVFTVNSVKFRNLKMLSVLKHCLIGYLGFLIILYVFQRSFIYHPTVFENYDTTVLESVKAIAVSEDGQKWLFLPSLKPTSRVLVYFHGNAGSAIDRIWKAQVWRESGFDVVLVEYPGYGVNEENTSEQNFYEVGRRVINKTLSDFPNTQLYIYGESIGSGTAVQMATEYDEEALILESGFSSLGDVVWSKFPFIPISLMLKDRFKSIEKINAIDSTLYMIHGKQDKTVPYTLGRKIV